MKLWRLARADHLALDGQGAALFGGRYSSPGRPLVSFASEAGLAVLVALRYLSPGQAAYEGEYRLGWTEIDAVPERVPDNLDAAAKVDHVDRWADTRRSLLIAVRSAVLPEADIVLMNALHPDAAAVTPLTARAFRFSDCLHRPPMLDRFAAKTQGEDHDGTAER